MLSGHYRSSIHVAQYNIGVESKIVLRQYHGMTKQETNFGVAIKKARLSQKLTYLELGNKCGLHPQNIRNAEAGHMPGIERANRILMGLGLTLTIGKPRGRKRIDYTPPTPPEVP